MRVKRQKIFRRYVRFYKVNYDFREPFNVLCDGNFLHHLNRQHLSNGKDSIGRSLSGSVRLCVTRCVLDELKKLGKQFQETYRSALSYHVTGCNHQPSITPSDCITALVQNGNKEHFFVATQDEELKSNLLQMPGVGILFGRLTAIMLEPPSEFQQEHAKSMENERSKISEKEISVLKTQAKKRKAMMEAKSDLPSKVSLLNGIAQKGDDTHDDGADERRNGVEGENLNEYKPERDNSELEAEGEAGEEEDNQSLRSLWFDEEEAKKRRNINKYKERPTFKRKFAKGPNPLSVKKKKSTKNSIQPQKSSEEKPKRKRLRKKRIDQSE